MMTSDPHLRVIVPPTVVLMRTPRLVVLKSGVMLRASLMRVLGNSARYQSDCMTALQSRKCCGAGYPPSPTGEASPTHGPYADIEVK